MSQSTTPQQGRPRMPRCERRQQILSVARAVFAEQGFHAAAMDDIAVRAGVSKPVLYQHFDGKLPLYLAVVDEAADDLGARLETALSGAAQDPPARVTAVVGAFFDFAADPEAGSSLLFRSDLMAERAVTERVRSMDAMVGELVTKGLLEEASLEPAQARLAAALVSTLPRVCAAYWLDHPELPQADAVALTSEMAWGALDVFP